MSLRSKLRAFMAAYREDHAGSATTFKTGAKVMLYSLGACAAGAAVHGVSFVLPSLVSMTAAATEMLSSAGVLAGFGGALIAAGSAAVSTVAGGAQYAWESWQNRKLDVVINDAGQRAIGPRWALRRLDNAQQDIYRMLPEAGNNIGVVFNAVSARPAVLAAQARVTILDSGLHDAGVDEWRFVARHAMVKVLG